MKKHFSAINIIVAVLCLLIFVSVSLGDESRLTRLEEIESDFNYLLRLLPMAIADKDKEVQRLLQGWEDYLTDIRELNNSEYQNILDKLTVNWNSALAEFAQCLAKTNQQERKAKYTWIDDLINKFGRSFIKANEQGVKRSFFAINYMNTTERCIKLQKNAAFMEVQRNAALIRYCNYFLDYIDKLGEKEKTKLTPRIDAAKKIIKIARTYPFGQLYEDTYLNREISLTLAKKYTDPKIFDFLSNHPELSKPFNLMKACDALNDVIKVK